MDRGGRAVEGNQGSLPPTLFLPPRTVSTSFKSATITPISRQQSVASFNDFFPIALTPITYLETFLHTALSQVEGRDHYMMMLLITAQHSTPQCSCLLCPFSLTLWFFLQYFVMRYSMNCSKMTS